MQLTTELCLLLLQCFNPFGTHGPRTTLKILTIPESLHLLHTSHNIPGQLPGCGRGPCNIANAPTLQQCHIDNRGYQACPSFRRLNVDGKNGLVRFLVQVRDREIRVEQECAKRKTSVKEAVNIPHVVSSTEHAVSIAVIDLIEVLLTLLTISWSVSGFHRRR